MEYQFAYLPRNISKKLILFIFVIITIIIIIMTITVLYIFTSQDIGLTPHRPVLSSQHKELSQHEGRKEGIGFYVAFNS